jgi:hypothetical protein
MVSTAIGLCSAALLKLGATPIQSFADGTAESIVADSLYPIVRDGLLSAHPWSFTIAQQSLGPPATPLSLDYPFAFDLPTECLRVLAAGAGGRGRGLAYRIHGNQLLTGSPEVMLSYQRRTPEALFPPFFVAALVARLAAELCLPLTESSTRADRLHEIAAAELRLARLIDSQQSTPRRVEDLTLIEAGLS